MRRTSDVVASRASRRRVAVSPVAVFADEFNSANRGNNYCCAYVHPIMVRNYVMTERNGLRQIICFCAKRSVLFVMRM